MSERRIRGTLFPVKLGQPGKATRLVIDTTDQDEYLILRNKKADELFHLIHHDLELTGTITEDDVERACIRVKSYILLNSGHDDDE